MLTKNVYILYPAGYSGTYLSWAVGVSDNVLYDSTVKDPINKSNSFQFGSQGTAHNHVRIPTHQDVFQHLSWVIHNRPTDKKIYLINSGSYGVNIAIRYLMQSDPTGVVVVIHNNNDCDVDAYGTINCITKWPTFTYANPALLGTDSSAQNFNCFESSRSYRNFIVNNQASFFKHMKRLDRVALTTEVNKSLNWYLLRNQLQPHEVNESTYITNYSLEHRVFELSCVDVASDRFPAWLQSFMDDSKVSDDYDCTHAIAHHDSYVNAQDNLKWFDSIRLWESTGQLDSYLTSHCGVEAHVILRIFKSSHKYILNNNQQDTWTNFYNKVKGNDWPIMISDEHAFYTLPKWIQHEILHDHRYQLIVAGEPNPAILHLDWENMSTEEINQVYQDTKQKEITI